jgi:hypothetical protein
MVKFERIAEAVLHRDALGARSLVQEWMLEPAATRDVARPVTGDPAILALAASLMELFAERLGQPAPAWTRRVPALEHPFFPVAAALRMRHLRELCERKTPEPLRKRRIFAPPNYLSFA